MRHALHPDHRVADVPAATGAMTVLHATEAATVHLAVHARTEGVCAADVDRSLYEDRSVVKQLAMRRTLFVFPRDLLPAALGSASARVAAEQRRLVARDAQRHGVADDGQGWLDAAAGAVLGRLAGSAPMSARALREELPELTGTVTAHLDKKYGGTSHLAPRVLTMLGAEGRTTRGPNAGHWRLSRPTWTLMADWLGEQPEPLGTDEGYAVLVRRWLRTFGPGTLDDLQWWLGSTRSAARAALAAVDAVPVSLDGDRTGWLLPDDVEPVGPVQPWAALLPTLDPTTMGWKQRDFYLDPEHTAYLFDSNGNGGATAWWDGRIVGAWVQDEEAAVRVVQTPDVDLRPDARAALEHEARRLTDWLDGVRISNVYSSALMKSGRLP
ncbi:winged helix DNA-binding domain-containing protein [Ornithinimicrobium avium]|uniref:Winged helix DNA-binding domain-containing protein n=2 Tax=Ornithinimicrobium avium TaxID=2283195 RepID=A0A345NSS4_9MICO|nr:winged helix DNA-binding domain-containing protein [Ornithinimicrobium avium]